MTRFQYFFWVFVVMFAAIVTGCGKEEGRMLRIGDTAPAFTAKDLDGNLIDFAQLAGKPVVIRFFVTDCKFCKADTIVFNEYYQKYKDKGLEIIYITKTVDPVVVNSFADDLQIKFPVIIDKDELISHKFGIRVVPQAIIMDPEHRIISAILGGVGTADLDEQLGQYFNFSPPPSNEAK